MAKFENEQAARFERFRGLDDEWGVKFVAFVAAVECELRFVIANFTHQRIFLAMADVGRITDDEVEETRSSVAGEIRISRSLVVRYRRSKLRHYRGVFQICEEVRLDEVDAIRDCVFRGVALSDCERCGGDIGSDDAGAGEFFGEGDGDAAGAGTDVGDDQAFAGEHLFAGGVNFAKSEAVESDFDQMFGFGPGNENVGRNFEPKAPKFLCAGKMLRGFARGSSAEQHREFLGVGYGDRFLGMRVKPGAIATEDVKKEKFGGEGEGRNVGVAQLRDALFKCSSNVHKERFFVLLRMTILRNPK